MKNFEKNGSEYKMKPQLGTYVPLVDFFLLLTIVGFIKIPESSFKWWMLGIVIILVVSLLRSFLFIDMKKKRNSGTERTLGQRNYHSARHTTGLYHQQSKTIWLDHDQC